jgi:hypothetical protein
MSGFARLWISVRVRAQKVVDFPDQGKYLEKRPSERLPELPRAASRLLSGGTCLGSPTAPGTIRRSRWRLG